MRARACLRNLEMNLEKLIVCVQSKNALWNQKSKDYHNRNLTKRLWEEVGQEMNDTVAAVKTKWRTMRDNFRKELNKMQGRSGTEGGKKPKWIYFETMSFLTDTLTSRPSSGNISMSDENSVMQSQDDTVSNQSDEVIRNEEEKGDANGDEEERDEEERNEEGRDEESQNFRTPKGQKRVNEEKIAFQSKKKKVTNIYDRLLALEEQKLDKLSSMCSKTDKDNTMDSDYMFLMSLLPQMKSLPPLRNMYMRLKIQQLFITEQEMLQSPINTTGRNAVEPPLMSPTGTYLSSSNNTFTYSSQTPSPAIYDNNSRTAENSNQNPNVFTYSSQTPSPATYDSILRTVENVTQNPNKVLRQPSDDTNIQRYFHTFN